MPLRGARKQVVNLRSGHFDVGELADGERRFEKDAAVDLLIVMAVARCFAGVG